MKFRLVFCLLILLIFDTVHSQERVRNLILMIPDGTSSSVLALARWYRYGTCVTDNCRLAIDPHICGLVSTYNSDSPIGDSAPTAGAYSTGFLSNTGFIAMYPISSGKERDLIQVDADRAYHPLLSILEAAKLQGKATGLVMTSQFTHATPANYASHTNHRDEEESIAIQMVHNNINLVFGGGLGYLDPATRKDGMDLMNVLRTRAYTLATTRQQFESLTPEDTLIYALFADRDLPNDLDRDPEKIPSLAEMTRKAIRILSKNPNGFFLMVEGSKVDWSAHINDPIGVITEFLAFDDAVKEAMEFANRDGYTAVVIAPDHGNGGISVGNSRSNKGYDRLPVGDLVKPLRGCKMTADGITLLIREHPEQAGRIFTENTGMSLSEEEIKQLTAAIGSADSFILPVVIAKLINKNTYVGFTTFGHTGEDVMLAVYHPANYRPSGVVKNVDLNRYMTEILALSDLGEMTEERFCIDTVALKGLSWAIVLPANALPKLVIRTDERTKERAEITASTDYMTIYRKEKPVQQIPLHSIAVYVDPLKHFFLPKDVRNLIP